MSKIDRTRLARGTKLLTDHVHVPLSSIAAQLNASNVDAYQLQQRHGTFRINLNFASIGAEGPFYDQNPWSVPFCLPPLQEYWDVTSRGGLNQWNTGQGTPQVFLDELSLGFDQKDAPAAIISEGDFGTNALNTSANFADYATLQAYDFTISLVEKSQEFFGGSDDLYRADRTIFSIPLEEVLFSGLERRENPLVLTDINQVMNPYKTYAFVIHAPNLSKITGAQDVNYYALVSLTISLKFRADLVQRDAYDAAHGLTPQNFPTKDSYQATRSRTAIGQAISITTPAAGATITADDATGVNTNYELIDRAFREKMRGGYNTLGEVAGRQEIDNDASYEVIAVPLLGNQICGGVVDRRAGDAPYCDPTTATGTQVIADRRFIPIVRPLTVHHVILAWNWQKFRTYLVGGGAQATTSPSRAAAAPYASTFRCDVGVGAISGLRGDLRTYQSIASHTMIGPYDPNGAPMATWSSTMFDRIRVGENSADPRTVAATAAAVQHWDWEMHYIPIRGAANPAGGGSGYYSTDKEFFVGKGWSPIAGRSNVVNSAGSAAPVTLGQEQLLEVRMRITDPTLGMGVGTAGHLGYNLTGYGGHYLYLICKKALT
jgi:hypothetical protein